MPPALFGSPQDEFLPPDPEAHPPEFSQEEQAPATNGSPAPPPDPDPAAEELWNRILEDLDDKIDETSHRVWFAALIPVGLTAKDITLQVPTAFAKEYIEDRFQSVLLETLGDHLGRDAALHLVVGDAPAA